MTDKELQVVDQIVQRNGNGHSNLIHVLQDMNSEFGFLPEGALRRVSEVMAVPLVEVCGMATFFKSFRLEPRGRHLITVCMGTACHVRGAPRVVDKMEQDLGIHRGQTTSDQRFTLETVNCVGACALGPTVIIDGEYHGQVNANEVDSLLKEYE